jgi:hypothetical protein
MALVFRHLIHLAHDGDDKVGLASDGRDRSNFSCGLPVKPVITCLSAVRKNYNSGRVVPQTPAFTRYNPKYPTDMGIRP